MMSGMRNLVRALLLCGLAAQAGAATGFGAAERCDAGPQIQRLVVEALEARGISEQEVLPFNEELCWRAARVRSGEAIELMKVRWDEVLRSIEFRLRCKTAGACLPFLLRVQTRAGGQAPSHATVAASSAAAWNSDSTEASVARAVRLPRLVRPGQMVTLIWEQGEMRVERRVVCLDSGARDQEVRTRGKEGGRVVRARVLAAGLVKAL
jgi:hypothetical protein